MAEPGGMARVLQVVEVYGSLSGVKFVCLKKHKLNYFSAECPKCKAPVILLNPKNDHHFFLNLPEETKMTLIKRASDGEKAADFMAKLKESGKYDRGTRKELFRAFKFAEAFVKTPEFENAMSTGTLS